MIRLLRARTRVIALPKHHVYTILQTIPPSAPAENTLDALLQLHNTYIHLSLHGGPADF